MRAIETTIGEPLPAAEAAVRAPTSVTTAAYDVMS